MKMEEETVASWNNYHICTSKILLTLSTNLLNGELITNRAIKSGLWGGVCFVLFSFFLTKERSSGDGIPLKVLLLSLSAINQQRSA